MIAALLSGCDGDNRDKLLAACVGCRVMFSDCHRDAGLSWRIRAAEEMKQNIKYFLAIEQHSIVHCCWRWKQTSLLLYSAFASGIREQNCEKVLTVLHKAVRSTKLSQRWGFFCLLGV